MKKLNYLWMLGLLMFAAVNFSACSSDDDDAPGSSSELVGLWESVSFEGWEKEDGEIVYEWEDDDDEARVKLNSDGTFVTYEYYSGEWDLCDTGTWEYKNGKIYTTFDDEEYEEEATEVATVKELTSTRLVIEEYEKDGSYEYWGKSVYRKISE